MVISQSPVCAQLRVMKPQTRLSGLRKVLCTLEVSVVFSGESAAS